jgi:lysophospholipase L1-like esterase
MHKPLLQIKRGLILLQTGWSILGVTLVLLLLAEIGFRVSFAVRDRLGAEPAPDPRVIAEGYGGDPWPRTHFRELEQIEERWQPYAYYRPRPFHGSTVNVDSEGLRKTWQSPPGTGDPIRGKRVKVLTLGGSSLWGFGARDDRTIPSLIGRAVHDRGWHVELKNLAQIGYVSSQELVALVRALQGGYRPDVVIFYDGVNDTTSAFLESEAGLTTNESNRRREFNLLQSPGRLAKSLCAKLMTDSGSYRFAQAVRRRFGEETGAARTAPDEATLIRLAGDVALHYAANVRVVEALGREYGFRPLFFWQPIVFTKPALTPLERVEAERFAWTERVFRSVYDVIRASSELKADPAFHDLSRIFEGTAGFVFIDYCHTTESAAEPIAAAIVERLVEQLR